MKSFGPIASLSLAVFAAGGCATQSQTGRFAGDVVASGAGFVGGDQLSGGNKAVAFGSGAVALGLKRLVENANDKKRMAELDAAYQRGMAQEAKLSYLAIQNSQRLGTPEPAAMNEAAATLTAIPISAPARTINGVKINPTVESVYITTR
jgi:hypothetical protein